MQATKIFVYLQQKIYFIPYLEEYERFNNDDYVLAELPEVGKNATRIKLIKIEMSKENVKDDIKIIDFMSEDDHKDKIKSEEVAKEDFKIFKEKIIENNLQMKAITAQVSLDQNFFHASFLADERIDFRNLVRDLSMQINKKVFFEQVGTRDRAKIIGDLGKCGRLQCCKNNLNFLPSVSMDTVRSQNLSSQQLENITGVCGKLKCCLNYEIALYKTCIKDLPKIKEKVFFDKKLGIVQGLDILNKKVKIKIEETGEVLFVNSSEILRKNK